MTPRRGVPVERRSAIGEPLAGNAARAGGGARPRGAPERGGRGGGRGGGASPAVAARCLSFFVLASYIRLKKVGYGVLLPLIMPSSWSGEVGDRGQAGARGGARGRNSPPWPQPHADPPPPSAPVLPWASRGRGDGGGGIAGEADVSDLTLAVPAPPPHSRSAQPPD